MPFYAKNQMVWAKIKGYPWWPAIVAKSSQTRNGAIEDEVLVNFIGENSHAVVAMDKIADFEENFEQFCNNKNKKLQESIKVAQRILDGITTYEGTFSPTYDPLNNVEEKDKLKRKKNNTKQVIVEKKTPEKEKKVEKPEKPEKKREPEVKDSPRVSRAAQKAKEKEIKLEAKYEKLYEFVPHRFTRSRSRKENIEMLTEPLIYTSRKSHRSPTKGRRRGSSKTNSRREKSDDEEEDNDNDNEDGDEGEEDNDMDDTARSTKEVNKSDVGSSVKASTPSKPTGKRGGRGRKKNTAKNSANKHKSDSESEEEEKMLEDRDEAQNDLVKEDIIPKDFEEQDHDIELAQMLEDVDENEECESFDLNIETYLEQEAKAAAINNNTEEKNDNNKRRAYSNDEDFPSPTYATQVSGRDLKNLSENECIIKKIKLTAPVTEERMSSVQQQQFKAKEGPFPNSSTKTVMAYNSLKIKKFENDLEQVLNKVSKKFQNKEKLAESDLELVQLLNVVREFENNTFSGAEFINSDLGKLFKTVHFLFTKNKELLCKSGDNLVPTLARVLHKIKNKILQFCLDNTDLVESLHLPGEYEELPHTIPVMAAINVDESRTKIEDQGTDSNRHNVPQSSQNTTSITTKMEDEDTSKCQRTPTKAPVTPNKKEDMLPTSSHAYKAETDGRTSYQQQQQNSRPPVQGQGQRPEIAQISNFQLRRKICQKFAALLQRVYSMQKEKSQELTLTIEDRINNYYSNNVNDYKQAIKGLLKIIKANKLEVEELVLIPSLELSMFSNMLNQKLENTTGMIESPENSVSTAPEKKRFETYKSGGNNSSNTSYKKAGQNPRVGYGN